MAKLDHLQDQYEDAYFALLMQEAMEQDGVRLEQLNETLRNDPDAAVPEEIDQACLGAMDRYFAQKKRAGHQRTAKTILGRIGIAAAIIVLLFTTAFALSEEFRVSTLNLLITVEEQYTELHMEKAEASADNPAPITSDAGSGTDYFDDLEIGWMPEGYTCTKNYPNSMYGFENESGDAFVIDRASGTTNMSVDTEDAESVEYIDINGIETLRITKQGCIHTIMMDTEHGIFIRVWTSAGIPPEANQKMAESIKYIG